MKFVWLPLLLSLGGCVNIGIGDKTKAPEVVYYVLDDAGDVKPAAKVSGHVLIMTDAQAGAFYDTDGMAFSKTPGTRGYYQYARWSERVSKRFSDLMLARLERSKIFTAVAQPGTNVAGDWLMTTEVTEFYHDATTQPGKVIVQLRAELIDLKSRRLIARKILTRAANAPSYDAAGAHSAFDSATTQLLDGLTFWLSDLTAGN